MQRMATGSLYCTGILPGQRLPGFIKLTGTLKTTTGSLPVNSMWAPLSKNNQYYMITVNDKLIKVPLKIAKAVKEKK